MIKKMKENKLLLEKHYSGQKNPVLHGVIGALYEDSINACVLLGQRNLNQVEVAGTLGESISKKTLTGLNRYINSPICLWALQHSLLERELVYFFR